MVKTRAPGRVAPAVCCELNVWGRPRHPPKPEGSKKRAAEQHATLPAQRISSAPA